MIEAPPEIAAAIRVAFGEAGAGVSLEPLAGGRSGAQLYTFRVGGADYVIRKAGMLALAGAADRARRELECMSIAAARAVAPAIVYADPARAIVIMVRIAGASINRGTPRDGDPLGRLAATLRTLHGGPAFPAGPSSVEMVRGLDAAARARGAPPRPIPSSISRSWASGSAATPPSASSSSRATSSGRPPPPSSGARSSRASSPSPSTARRSAW